MNTTDANFKPTPGPWTSETTPSNVFVTRAIYGANGELVAHVGIPGYRSTPDVKQNTADAALIAEAGTVYHETGKTPRRLAEENAALLAALEAAAERMEHVSQSVLIDKRHRGVSPATHVRHMAAHLEQHAKRARAAADKAKGGPTCAT